MVLISSLFVYENSGTPSQQRIDKESLPEKSFTQLFDISLLNSLSFPQPDGVKHDPTPWGHNRSAYFPRNASKASFAPGFLTSVCPRLSACQSFKQGYPERCPGLECPSPLGSIQTFRWAHLQNCRNPYWISSQEQARRAGISIAVGGTSHAR